MSEKTYINIIAPFTENDHLDGASSERAPGDFIKLKNYIPESDILRTRKGITIFTHTPEATVVITNDFSGSEVVSWYKMDTYAGDLFADSKGSNPVTAARSGIGGYITQDTTNTIAPGLNASLDFDNAPSTNSAFGTIAYGDQGTPIPGSIGVDTTFSVVGWFRYGQAQGRLEPIISRWNQDSAARCWDVDITTGAGTSLPSLRFLLRDNGGGGAEANYQITSSDTINAGDWYHFNATYDSATLTATLRIVNSNSTTVFSGNVTLPNGLKLTNQSMQIANLNQEGDIYCFDGNLQEIVIFNKVITDAEQDKIVVGTYP
jgi:hypothetical protein